MRVEKLVIKPGADAIRLTVNDFNRIIPHKVGPSHSEVYPPAVRVLHAHSIILDPMASYLAVRSDDGQKADARPSLRTLDALRSYRTR